MRDEVRVVVVVVVICCAIVCIMAMVVCCDTFEVGGSRLGEGAAPPGDLPRAPRPRAARKAADALVGGVAAIGAAIPPGRKAWVWVKPVREELREVVIVMPTGVTLALAAAANVGVAARDADGVRVRGARAGEAARTLSPLPEEPSCCPTLVEEGDTARWV